MIMKTNSVCLSTFFSDILEIKFINIDSTYLAVCYFITRKTTLPGEH